MAYKSNSESQKGFTLVELILYVALVSLFLTGAILFSWDVVYGREKSVRQQIVQQSARIAMAKIGYEITRASDINSMSANQIVLNNGATNTTIALSAGKITISTGGTGPYNLTSNQVIVTSLIFSNLQSINQDTNNIKVSMTLTQANSPAKGELTATTTIDDSFEVKGEFNQARRLLIGTAGSTLTGGTSLTGITIQNVESTNITIDKMFVSWSGVPADRMITSVQIEAGSTEWTGSAASGTQLELTDFLIAGGLAAKPVSLAFNLNMDGAVIDFYFIMSDGSTAKAKVSLYTYTSCQQICLVNGYTNWICRAAAATCTTNSETNVVSGNSLCTGGANGDTCCCK